MFGLKFMIILMNKFNKVSHITFQPYKFRQGLRFTLFLIFHRSQELWSESFVGIYFLDISWIVLAYSRILSLHIPRNFVQEVPFFLWFRKYRVCISDDILTTPSDFFRYFTPSPDKLWAEIPTGTLLSPYTHFPIYYSLMNLKFYARSTKR
jgi:hypothetical protein